MKKLFLSLFLIGCATQPKTYVRSETWMPQAIQICTNDGDIAAMERMANDKGCFVPKSSPYIVQPKNCIFYECRKKPQFKVGDCIVYYFTSSIEDYYTGKLVDYPSCHVSDRVESKILSVSEKYYKIEESQFSTPYNSIREIEYIDHNYVRVNCEDRKKK
jgi:hypothetical protein